MKQECRLYLSVLSSYSIALLQYRLLPENRAGFLFLEQPKIPQMKVNVVSQESPKLLDRMRAEIRVRHYSIRTEETYVDWARRFILFNDKRHPKELGAEEVRDFLSHLAVDRNVAASTQNRAKGMLRV